MHNLIANLFKKIKSPCIQEFPEIKIKRQILDHYIKDDCNTISSYGIFVIEVLPAQPNQTPQQKQTEDIDLKFSKVFTKYIENRQHHISERAKSIFTNDGFSIFYSYISELHLK